MAVTNIVSPSTIIFTLILILTWRVFGIWWEYKSLPGPLHASLTNFVRLYWTRQNYQFDKYSALHRQFGALVRTGPNVVSVSDPTEIRKIYGFICKDAKPDVSQIVLPYVNGEALNCSITPIPLEAHVKVVDSVAKVFAATDMLQSEELVDSSVTRFLERIDNLFLSDSIYNLASWPGLLVYDIMGVLTFSGRYGCVNVAQGIRSVAESVNSRAQSVPVIRPDPWYDLHLQITSWVINIFKEPGLPLVASQIHRAIERQALLKSEGNPPDFTKCDLLSRSLRVKARDPGSGMTWIATNSGAVGEVTAAMLTALIHYIVMNNVAYHRLMSELTSTKLSNPPTLAECLKLRYLDACIRETERLHPAIGTHLERKVCSKGVVVSRKFLKCGTIVGMNSWVVNRDRSVFGVDADVWNPRRWLVNAEKYMEMEKSVLTFGANSRTCYGVAIARLIVCKTASSLFKTYKVVLEDEKRWKSGGKWLTSRKGAFVKFEKL